MHECSVCQNVCYVEGYNYKLENSITFLTYTVNFGFKRVFSKRQVALRCQRYTARSLYVVLSNQILLAFETVSCVTILFCVVMHAFCPYVTQKRLISLSGYSILNDMYADRPVKHFGFLCEWPTICGAKKHRHGGNDNLGHFEILFNKIKIKYILA